MPVVWSLRIRILHWLMAICIVINLFVFDEGELIHLWLGYLALVLVFLRIIIGVTAKDYSAFKKFSFNFNQVYNFIKTFLSRNRKNYQGHNPLASYAFIFFWSLTIILGVTGILLVHTDRFWGDPLVEDIHEYSSKAVIAFIIFHFIGILSDSLIHKRKTWVAMLTGRK